MNSKFGLNLKNIRNKCGISKNSLSKKTGFSRNYITRLENGKAYDVTTFNANKFAKSLNVPLQYLVSGEPEMSTEIIDLLELVITSPVLTINENTLNEFEMGILRNSINMGIETIKKYRNGDFK